MRLTTTLLACICLQGCSYFVYKMDVQQGNYVTQDVVARVKTGMTKAEVRQILGTPLLSDPFHANRWDYYFSADRGHVKENRTQLSIFFENDRVVSIKGEGRPPAPAPVGQATAPQPQPAGSPAPALPPPSAAAPAPQNPPATATVPAPAK
jgi:outer membrane protein assembly factor BamE